MHAHKIKTADGYDFWRLTEGRREWWNITPAGSPEPDGGYRSKTYIEKIKHQTFTND